MQVNEVVKALRWIASNDEICFNAEQVNVAADLLERLQAKLEAITKDRDQWRVAAEASRDVIRPKLRAEIAELKAKNEQLQASQPVRCKECKYLINTVKNGEIKYGCNCLGIAPMKIDDYCSYGERRETE